MALFEGPDKFRTLQGGAQSFTVVQKTPDSGAISGARVGTGAAAGDTTFTVQPASRHILPSECYFRMRVTLAAPADTGLVDASVLANRIMALSENWANNMFSTVRLYLNGTLLEEQQWPAVADMAATVSSASGRWFGTYSSAAGVGQPWTERVAQLIGPVAAGPTDTSQGALALPVDVRAAQAEVCFKPPLSWFNTPFGILDTEWRIVFSWSPRAETSCVEASSLACPVVKPTDISALVVHAAPANGTATTQYTVTCNGFDMFVATIQPAVGTPLPKRILLDLSPIRVIQQPIVSQDSTFNIAVPPSTYRLGFCFQQKTAGQSSRLPTSIIGIPQALTRFRWTSSELGLQAPLPDYAFTALSVAGGGASVGGIQNDIMRAYNDFCQASQGQAKACEGCVPLGQWPSDAKIPQCSRFNTPSTANINNGATTAVVYNDVPSYGGRQGDGSAYGWLGRYGMFLFNVFKPPGGKITQINVDLSIATTYADWNMYVLCWHTATGSIKYDDKHQVEGSLIDLTG